MSLILALETATPVCSVALARDGEVLSIRESDVPNAHSSVLTVFIEEVFQEVSLHYTDLDAVSVSMGPGSYTGLRIGVAVAKGLCFALDKPLIAIPTLEAMAAGMRVKGQGTRIQHPASGIRDQIDTCLLPTANCQLMLVPMIDARRMEVYCAVFDENLNQIHPTDALIVHEHSFTGLLKDHVVLFAGTGAEKSKKVLSHQPSAIFVDGFQASSRFLITLSEQRFAEQRFENLAYFEPFYLKDFIAGKPHVKGLR